MPLPTRPPLPPLAPPGPPDPGRRKLLGAAGNTAAACAALAVTGPAAVARTAPATAPAQAGPAPRQGYHETEHTRRYYRLARY
jgi:hypothetical protein